MELESHRAEGLTYFDENKEGNDEAVLTVDSEKFLLNILLKLLKAKAKNNNILWKGNTKHSTFFIEICVCLVHGHKHEKN